MPLHGVVAYTVSPVYRDSKVYGTFQVHLAPTRGGGFLINLMRVGELYHYRPYAEKDAKSKAALLRVPLVSGVLHGQECPPNLLKVLTTGVAG